MKKKIRLNIHILLPLMLIVFPLGLFFIIRLDTNAVDFIIDERSDYLKHILNTVDYSFSSYEQLISTTVEIVENLPLRKEAHEGALQMVFDSSRSALVYGIGIWYEPGLFQPGVERFGPYIRQTRPLSKEGEITYFWNTPEYDYQQREWYHLSMKAEGDDAAVTPPFFDNDYTYITFGKPFYRDGRKAGVVTVDIILPLLEDYFDQFDFSFFSGIYLTTSDDSIVISKTVADSEALYRYSLEGEHPGLFVDRTAIYDREEIRDFFQGQGQKPAILDHQTLNGVFKIHGFMDRRAIFRNMVRRHLFNYIFYLFFWTAILIVVLLGATYQRRNFENRILNSENDLLKEEIKKRQEAEKRLGYLAFHDEISGLDNIQSFLAKEEPPEKGQDSRSLIYLSLTNMRELSLIISDSLIDDVLEVFAERLRSHCPETARLYRGRGFSFYVVCTEKGDRILADNLLKEFRKPMQMGARDIRLRIRTGLVRFKEADTLNQLLSMSHSTVSDESVRNLDQVSLYNSKLQSNKTRILMLDTAMSQPEFTEELMMVYQPIAGTADRRAVGCEALVRWHSRALESIISPVEFIPLAEENGVIITLGWFVMEEVLKVLSGPLGDRDFFISVNVSPLQFLEIDFADKLDGLMTEYKVDRRRIKLEITESSAAAVIDSFWQIAEDLIKRGYLLAIDDFGTGESSFYRLYNMSFDSLKIDRSFVAGAFRGSRNQEICRSLLELGNTMGSSVIAEGVETEEEFQALKEIGVSYVQGYLLSRPLSLEKMLESPLLG